MTSLRNGTVVEFRFLRPGATEVSLAGDFLGWSRLLPMHKSTHGWWTAELTLEPGEYRFRYVADGQWYTDFASHGVEYHQSEWNSVLLVPEAVAPRPAQQHGGSFKARNVLLIP